MHSFDELILRSTSFSLTALDEASKRVNKELEEKAYTTSVKAIEAIQLQKVVMSVGAFAIFDAYLQNALGCEKGFDEASKILEQLGEDELLKQFNFFILAVNVLKHGKGRSYEKLILEYDELPFRIKLPEESFFFEGDVSEVSPLIEVTDRFVLDCSELIGNVIDVLRSKHNGFRL